MPHTSSKLLLLCALSLPFAGSTLLACGGGDDSAESGASSPASRSPTDPAPSPSSPGAPSDPAKDLAGAKYLGSFHFQSSPAGATGEAPKQTASAVFTDSDPQVNGQCEAPEVVGQCSVLRCALTASSTLPALNAIDPGVVTVKSSAGEASLTPTPRGIWTNKLEGLFTWKPGDKLTGKVTGAPGGAPAFELTTEAPSPVIMTSPTLPASVTPTPLKHTRSRDLVATWSAAGGGGGGAGKVRITVVGAEADKMLFVQCEAPSAAAQTAVPPALLARFDSPRVQMTLGSWSSATKRDGDWALSVFSSAPAVTPDGREATTFVEFE